MDITISGTSSRVIRLIIVYRPPSSRKNRSSPSDFIREFSTLLECLCVSHQDLLITGDFNLHVDVPGNGFADSFIELLQSNALQIHNDGPTHTSGHTLDLIISRTETCFVSNVSVQNHLPSDHAAVICNLLFEEPPKITKHVVSRKLKSIDMDTFRHDLSCMLLSVRLDRAELEPFTSKLCSGLRDTLESHAPLLEREVTLRPHSPWYSDIHREAKRQRRRCERQMQTSKLQVHKEIYQEQCKIYNKLLSSSKTNFHRDQIQTSNQQSLYGLVNKLSSPSGGSVLPRSDSPVNLANRFAEFFKQKITTIMDNLTGAKRQEMSVDLQDNCPFTLHDFGEVSEKNVSTIVKSLSSASCELDPLPTTLTKKCIDILLPSLTTLVNASLSSGLMPCLFKKAIVSPLLKKAGTSQEELANYRPISHLNFFGKVIEKAAMVQITEYLTEHSLNTPTQSAYRRHHSVETALARVHNDILLSLDNRQEALLVLLDYSSAFDTIDHTILLDRLAKRYGFGGSVLKWVSSYISSRSHVVNINNHVSQAVYDDCGVPQGSVIGPLLFTLYSAPLYDIITAHGLSSMIYADDTQVYLTFPATDREIAISRINNCLQDITSWSIKNKLLVNAAKTELIHFTSRYAPSPPAPLAVTVDGVNIAAVNKVRNLGVIMDKHLSMSDHITKTCQSAIAAIRKIGQIRQYLNRATIEILVQSLVMSHIDNCNVLLYSLPNKELKRLQRIQNTAARLIVGARSRDPISPILHSLHWLPVEKRVIFKILLMCYKVEHTISPLYLIELIHRHTSARTLRSSSQQLLTVPLTNTQTYGNRPFAKSAPTLWNTLPLEIRKIPSINSFKQSLKTFLFV